MRVRPAILATLLALACAAPAAQAGPGSLYTGSGPRPGPDLLYRDAATAPQLTNGPGWDARPILVSGASAYRDGEFLYQDFLYDDHGAQGDARDPGDPRNGDDSFSLPNGTYTYPTDEAYAQNAADLVELRVEPRANATAFRITLNTMKDPALAAATVAIGNSATERQLPYGANTTAPAQLFLTVHGGQGDLVDAATGKRITGAVDASVDRRRRQLTALVDHDAWNPGSSNVRLAAGVGLWDTDGGGYLIPDDAATENRPGGAVGLEDPSALFNVAFRHDEPLPDVGDADAVFTNPRWWRDDLQGEGLKDGSLRRFQAIVDFGKLNRGASDELRGDPAGVPTTGPIDRILASHFETKQGVDFNRDCGRAGPCAGQLRGNLQPYSIYVPRGPRPAGGLGLTLLLHSLGGNYNQFHASRNQSQLGERAQGSIVITPSGRGPDGWYYGHAGADTFEVWADVARRYDLDDRWTSISGYSMGGYGTYKLATQFPDLFARANPVVGPPGVGIWLPPGEPEPGGEKSNTFHMLASLRNIPTLIWAGSSDELVPIAGPTRQAQGLDDLGYRYTFDVFTPGDHFTLAANDEYGPVARFLNRIRVKRNPAHVTYVRNPTMDFPALDFVADHAYWLSGMELRNDSGEAPRGRADALSHGFGEGDPDENPTETGSGTLQSRNLGALSYTERRKTWDDPPATPRRDKLDLDLENLSRVIVDTKRAKLSCRPDLDVTTDGPVTVKLGGCGRSVEFD